MRGFGTSGPQVKLFLTGCTVELKGASGVCEGQRFVKRSRKLIFKDGKADRSLYPGHTVEFFGICLDVFEPLSANVPVYVKMCVCHLDSTKSA